jgi:hypothetical protein
VSHGKEHAKHAKIMETKGIAILACRHWDSPKIKKKQTNKHLLAQKNGSPLRDLKTPSKELLITCYPS